MASSVHCIPDARSRRLLGTFPALLTCGLVGLLSAACEDAEYALDPEARPATARVEGRAVAEGRHIFRNDDFGDWRFWTDTLRLNVLVEGITPNQALELGLKVDGARPFHPLFSMPCYRPRGRSTTPPRRVPS
ncbi:MAG TPA: hypothetical protein VML95_02555 [Longimicrobiales bacterium]|nr:hypothetical protein [Longimicrobiales bacterium]